MSIAPTTHVESAIPDYLAGALPDDERQAVEWHLRACASCREMRDSFADLYADRPSEPDAPAPGYFATILPRVRTRIDARRPAIRLHPLVSRLAIPMAATLLLVFGLIRISTRDNGDQPFPGLRPLFSEFSDQEVSDVLGTLDVNPLDALRSTEEEVFESSMDNLSVVPREVLRQALAEDETGLELDQLTSALEEEDWNEVLTKLDERTVL